jgi:hypothetical protein
MKLGDVLEVFQVLMLEKFLDQFIFIWRFEQCSQNFGQITPRSYYCIKDLKQVYYACRGFPFGIEDQTLLINDEPSNLRLQNPKCNGLSLKSFMG